MLYKIELTTKRFNYIDIIYALNGKEILLDQIETH
jgi:hypothetical protein